MNLNFNLTNKLLIEMKIQEYTHQIINLWYIADCHQVEGEQQSCSALA